MILRNLELKEHLCQKTEQLINEKSINTSFIELQKIHEKWKEIGPVAKLQETKFGKDFKMQVESSIEKEMTIFFP